MNFLSQSSKCGWNLCKTAFRYGDFVAIHLAAKARSIEPLIFGNSIRPYIDGLLGMIALGQITLGMGSLLGELASTKKAKSNWKETAQKLLKVAQGSLILTHLYNPSACTSLLVGCHLLATGVVRIVEGGSQLQEELRGPTLDADKRLGVFPKINRKSLAQAIVLCGLGIWGVHSSFGPITERLHHWQPLTTRMEVLRGLDNYKGRFFIRDSSPEISLEASYYHSWNDFIYDQVVQKEFDAYCADEAIATGSCDKKSINYLNDKYMERLIAPSILSQLQSSGIPSLEFIREVRKLCETQSMMNDLCRGFEYFNGSPLYEKILDTFKGINSLDRKWYKRLEGPDSASLIGKIFKDTQKRFNAAVIINGDDAPDALKYTRGLGSIPIELANVYVEKISNEQGICDILKNALAWSGKPLDLVSITGHGSQFGIRLSNKTELNTINVADVGDCFKKALAPGALIVLDSCSTGRQRPMYLNIAERLAGETGHPVDAPIQSSRSIECSYSFPQAETDSRVGSSPGDLQFHCVKKRKFKDDEDDMIFGTYTKRFIRDLSDLDEETIRFDSDF